MKMLQELGIDKSSEAGKELLDAVPDDGDYLPNIAKLLASNEKGAVTIHVKDSKTSKSIVCMSCRLPNAKLFMHILMVGFVCGMKRQQVQDLKKTLMPRED